MRRNKRSSNRQKNNFKDKDRLTDTGGLSRSDREADSRERRDCYGSKPNDPAWYAQNASLLNDYASFPFGYPLGNVVPGYGTPQPEAIPGICALYLNPMVGIASVETDPINIAMRNIYSFVRHANSGHTNYEAPDLMMYLVAMDSVYSMHAWMKRLLGVVMLYTPVNRYYPQAILRAMGVDPDDLRDHIADFRGFVNTYAVQMGSMCVPNSMSYMARHTWMYEGLYLDSATSKAQTYFYTPEAFYRYNINATSSQGELITVPLLDVADLVTANPTLLKVADIIRFARELLTPIITNEDLNIMSGDILKAFGAEGVVKVSGVLDGYMVLPTYSPEVQSQIENATVLGGVVTSTVGQDTAIGGGYIKADNTILYPFESPSGNTVPASWFVGINGPKLLNFHIGAPTPSDVMVATRLVSRTVNLAMTVGPNNSIVMPIISCGSEVVAHALIWNYRGTIVGGNQVELRSDTFSSNMIVYGDYDLVDMYRLLHSHGAWDNFDWAPFLTYIVPTASGLGAAPNATMPVGDVDTYTTLTPYNIQMLHTTALLSEFSVPQMGSFSKSV